MLGAQPKIPWQHRVALEKMLGMTPLKFTHDKLK